MQNDGDNNNSIYSKILFFRIRYWDMATGKINLFPTFLTNFQSYNYNKLSNF